MTKGNPMKVFSFGGGVQSVAALVLSAQGKLPYTHFIFANVGDDSENPDTLSYMENVVWPYAVKHHLQMVVVKRDRKSHQSQTLLQHIWEANGDIPIPIFFPGRLPSSRNCTSQWKIKVIEKWMKDQAGASKQNRIPIGIGISVDESHRMRTDDPEREPYLIKEYPLIELMMTRAMCQDVIHKAGLPIPPKSACWFCPYKLRSDWANLRTKHPILWTRAVEIEEYINDKRKRAGKGPVYITSFDAPIENVIPLLPMNMFDDGNGDDDSMTCESGYCMT